MKPDVNEHVLEAINRAGGPSALARKLSALLPEGTPPLTPQAVSDWRAKGRIPAVRVLPVEKITNVSRHDLRPDFYPRRRRRA